MLGNSGPGTWDVGFAVWLLEGHERLGCYGLGAQWRAYGVVGKRGLKGVPCACWPTYVPTCPRAVGW